MTDTSTPPAHVLLVEDTPDQAYLMKVLIEGLGPYRVTVVQDGLRALERATADPVDMVVTDLNLPGMDGFQLVADLKKRQPHLPVLAVTGYDNPAHVEGARRAGADAVELKPVAPDTLARRLAELLATGPESEASPAGVLAVGYRPGDLELGCGGTLLGHAAAGEPVTILVLSGPGDAAAAATRLGARLLGTPDGDAPAALRELAAWVRAERPRIAYLPSPRDADATRSVVFEAARDALRGIPRVLGYATPTSSPAFRPEHFEEIGSRAEGRRLALQALAEEGVPHLPPADFADAQALYWGRFADFRPVEPFEILRDGTRP